MEKEKTEEDIEIPEEFDKKKFNIVEKLNY
jgi:hypothetical protein